MSGTNSGKVKERLRREQDLMLAKAVSISRAEEESKKKLSHMSEDAAELVVHAMKHDTQARAPTTRIDCDRQCHNCGFQHPKGRCPEYGKRCMNCSKYNHFAKQCRAKKAAAAEGAKSVRNTGEEHRLTSAIKAKTETTDSECYVNLELQGTPVKLKVDTGSQANILPQKVFQSLKEKPKLTRMSTKLTSYTGNILPILGQCKLTCEGKDLEFFVVRTNQSPILCFKASQELGLIKVILNINKADSLVKQYKDVFEGLGCLKTPYRIKVDLSVHPTICPPRNKPVALKSRIKEELDRMEQMKVIKKEEEPTEWVNAMVVVEKPRTKKLRICLDPRPLNKAILREHYQLPSLEDISTRLTGAKTGCQS